MRSIVNMTGFLLVFLGWTLSVQAQILSGELSGPSENLINEEFCYQLTLSNVGDIGYQPYLRLFLPPEITTTSLDLEFMGEPVSTVIPVGTFAGSTLNDPLLPEGDANDLVSGVNGHSLVVVALPVGSLIEGGVELNTQLCMRIDGPGVTVGVPVEFEIETLYRYGNSPIGENGSLVGDSFVGSVTPTLYEINYSADRSDAVTGLCEPLEFGVRVNIAEQEIVSGLQINTELPLGLNYVDLLSVTPGCVVNQEPNADSPGNLIVTCNNVNGSSDPVDVELSFFAYPDDVLDVNNCDSLLLNSMVSVVSNQEPQMTDDQSVTAYHMLFTPLAPTEELFPGQIVELGMQYSVAGYLDGINDFQLSLELPDGLSYLGNATFNGAPFSATSIIPQGDGSTLLAFDLHQANGGDLVGCSSGQFLFEALIENTYDGGELLSANDPLIAQGTVTYGILNGIGACSRNFNVGYTLPGAEVTKELMTLPANGVSYAPGELVTYRLSMSFPTTNANEVVFEDLFPVPIHDVNDLSLIFGEDIVLAPTDNVGATPLAMTVDANRNSLTIEWGDLAGPGGGVPTIVAVDITLPISAAPFADGLTHSNFGLFSNSNTSAESSSSVDLTTLFVGSPELTIWKGIASTDQPNAGLSPIMNPINANASKIDAWDWITFRITLTNMGNAPAYDVILTDFPPFPELGQCSVLSVEDGEGTALPYSGSLFTSGLVIDEIPRIVGGSQAHKAYVNYQCRVQGNISARDIVVNTAEATWAAVDGGAEQFSPISDVASISFERPSIDLIVRDIQPGYAAPEGVQVGELITFEAKARIPEGYTRDATLEIELPEGLSFESFIEFEYPIDISYSIGSYNVVMSGLDIADVGADEEDLGRVITLPFGDIHNAASDNLDDEFFQFVFNATVLNCASNQNGQMLTPTVALYYENPLNGVTVSESNEVELELREPELTFEIEFYEPELLPGEQTFVTLTVSHGPGSTGNAYDVEVVNDLPLGLQFVSGSFLTECDELFAEAPENAFGSITAKWDSIPLGVTCEIVYSIEVVDAFPPCTFAENCLSGKYASGFEAHYDTLSYGPTNPIGYRRTGNLTDPGTVLNDHSGSSCAMLEVVAGNLSTPTITGGTEYCEGEQLVISIPEYSGTFVQYHWEGPGVPDGYNSHQLILTNVDPSESGTYTAWVEIGECSTPFAPDVEIIINENPVVTVAAVEVPCASGLEDVEIVPSVSGGNGPYSYEWTGPSFFSDANVAIIENATEEDTGVYQVNVTDSNGCTAATESFQVDIATAPALPVITAGDEICQGEGFVLNCNAYPGALAYHWVGPDQTIVTTSPSLDVDEASTAQSGNYAVWVELESCVSDTSFQVEVLVQAVPEPPVFDANSTELCAGELLIFSTSVDGDTYAWSGPNGYSASTQNPPAIEAADILASGTYELVVSQGICTSDPFTLDVLVHQLPATPGLGSNSPVCIGDQITLNTTNTATAYRWIFPDNSQQNTNDPFFTIEDAVVADEGDYTLSVFDGTCWSLPSNIEVVQVDVVPSEQAFAGNNVTACEGSLPVVQANNDPDLLGFWETIHEEIVISSPNNQSTAVNGLTQGESYLLIWSLYTEGCGVYSTDEVSIYAPIPPEANNDLYETIEGQAQDLYVVTNDVPGPVNYSIDLVDLPDNGTAQVAGDAIIEYRPAEGWSGEDELIYELCLADCPTMCDTAIVKLTVFPYLNIPDIITPNGDNANDVFVIDGIERFPENELYIYNRWGREVFAAENYENNWDAMWQGQPLPDGTYFYILRNRATGETLGNGYVTVHQ